MPSITQLVGGTAELGGLPCWLRVYIFHHFAWAAGSVSIHRAWMQMGPGLLPALGLRPPCLTGLATVSASRLHLEWPLPSHVMLLSVLLHPRTPCREAPGRAPQEDVAAGITRCQVCCGGRLAKPEGLGSGFSSVPKPRFP